MIIKLSKDIYTDRYLCDKYSKYANEDQKIDGIPYINFPFLVQEIDKEYNFISWILIDYDSNPVVQFSWVHWLVANYEVKDNQCLIPENLLESNKVYLGGINSFAGPCTNLTDSRIISNYGGPTPPDKDHTYTLIVYAHNEKLNLNNSFYYNELIDELEKVNYSFTQVKILAKK